MESVPRFELVEWLHSVEGKAKYPLGFSNVFWDESSWKLVDWKAIGEEVSRHEGYAHDSGAELARRLPKAFGVKEGEIINVMGTSEANSLVVQALAGHGREFVVDLPNYQTLFDLPPLFGARTVPVRRKMADGWRLPVERVKELVTRKTAAIYTCNLHNPTGAALMREELRALADIAADARATLVVDEIFRQFVEDDNLVPPVRQVAPEAVSTGSLSKVQGWGVTRLGWVCAQPELIERVRRLKTLVAPTRDLPNDAIALQVLDKLPMLRDRARRVARRGNEAMRAWVDSRKDVGWVPPYGGVVSFPKIVGVKDTVSLAKRALGEKGVLVSPGEYFGMPGHLRVGVGHPDAHVTEEGLRLLGEAIDEGRKAK
jgi:aspartate/methionine/tyrosine aminotransferase